MKRFLVVLSVFLIGLLHHTGAFPPVQSGAVRTRRDVFCRWSVAYLHAGICCSNCPAGTYVKAHCTRDDQRGQCEECEDGTFTEHDNHFSRCLPCTQCRSDEELVKPCSHTADATCQCQPGRFCHPDDACEVCRKCTSCKKDQELVRNCTPTSDTECKKTSAPRGTTSDNTVSIVLGSLTAVFVLMLIVAIFLFFYQRRGQSSNSNGDQTHTTKHNLLYTSDSVIGGEEELRRALSLTGRQLVRGRPCSDWEEEERKRLCNSLSSLTGLTAPPALLVCPPCARLTPPTWSIRREEEFPTLVPVKGEESLRSCFEYFEVLSMNHYKRFFRALGVNNNKIQGVDNKMYEERIHDLLNIWVEKEGRNGSLNHLLKALLDLDQRLTAETIKEQAIQDGHYMVED